MPVSFSYSVLTKLPRNRVWGFLTDIRNWPKFSNMYSDLHWEGAPWEEGSALVGQLNYPIVVAGRHIVRKHDPPVLIRYLSQTKDAGFATERTITLEKLQNGTLIRVEAYTSENPRCRVARRSSCGPSPRAGSMRSLTSAINNPPVSSKDLTSAGGTLTTLD